MNGVRAVERNVKLSVISIQMIGNRRVRENVTEKRGVKTKVKDQEQNLEEHQ